MYPYVYHAKKHGPRMIHRFSFDIEIDMVVVWVVEIDLISVWGIIIDLSSV